MSVSKLPQTVQSVQNVEDREDTDREDINKITNQQGLSESAVAELNVFGKTNLTSLLDVQQENSLKLPPNTELTKTYYKNGQYQDVLKIIEAVICLSNESQNAFNHITEANCLIKLDRIHEAEKTAKKIKMMLKSTNLLETLRGFSDSLENEIRALTESFIECKCFETSLILILLLHEILKFYHEDNSEKLQNYEKIAGLLESTVRETASTCPLVHECDKPQSMMEDILREMLNVKDVEVREKTIRIAWVYKYFAFCCDEVGNFTRAVELNRQGITAMKTVFGSEATRYKIFGHLYHNMAASLVSLCMTCKACRAYQRAIEIYNESEDWENYRKKSDIIKLTSKCLDRISRKSCTCKKECKC